MQKTEKKRVINAIGELGRRVTAADVATKTGLPVLVCTQALNQVATETRGHLQVGTTGDVAYSFAPGFSNIYLAKGVWRLFETVGEKLFSIAFYLLRISFGVMLILSLVFIVVVIVVLVTIISQSGRSDRSSDDSPFDWLQGMHFSFWDWMILRDLLWWNAVATSPVQYRYDQPTVRRPPRSNFLLNCFSFLFGDGDPNEGLDEKRWQLVAQVIKRHNNVVTSEQLAPYTGANPKNEDAVLPVLVRFNGKPEVTDSGNIVYVFESMHSIAADQYHNPPAYLKEFPWKITNACSSDLTPVYVVAGLNFVGAWGIWYTLLHPLNLDLTAVPLVAKLAPILNFLVFYGTAFLLLPLMRYGVQRYLNSRIASRNAQRFASANLIANPDPPLGEKLKEAVRYRVRDTHLSGDEVYYTTEKAALEQKDDLDLQFQSSNLLQNHAGKDSAAPTSDSQPDNIFDATPGNPDGSFDATPEKTNKADGDFDANP